MTREGFRGWLKGVRTALDRWEAGVKLTEHEERVAQEIRSAVDELLASKGESRRSGGAVTESIRRLRAASGLPEAAVRPTPQPEPLAEEAFLRTYASLRGAASAASNLLAAAPADARRGDLRRLAESLAGFADETYAALSVLFEVASGNPEKPGNGAAQ